MKLVNVSHRLAESNSDNKREAIHLSLKISNLFYLFYYLCSFSVPVLDNESLNKLETWNLTFAKSGPLKSNK